MHALAKTPPGIGNWAPVADGWRRRRRPFPRPPPRARRRPARHARDRRAHRRDAAVDGTTSGRRARSGLPA